MTNRAFSKIGIIIILVVLIAGGILAWQYFGAPKEEIKVPEEVKAPEEVVEDETANWKIYTNFKYGYEIRYPSDWTIEMESHLKEAAPRIVSPKSAEISGVLQIGARSLEEVPLPLSATARQAADQDKNAPYFMKRIIREEEVIIADAKGYRIIYITEYEGMAGPEEVVVQMVYLVRGGRLYTLSYEEQMSASPYTYIADYTKWKYANILKQMLSTFLFLEEKCKPVELKDVINYYDPSKLVYVKTSGIIVGLEYDDYGGSILLSDNSHYLLVAISHAGMGGRMKEILAGLRQGDKIEVEGLPSFTSPKVADLKNRLNLQQELPEIIGMLELVPCTGEGIKKK